MNMSDDPAMSSWTFLLQTTEEENKEERHIAQQLAEASLQRAKNRGVLLDALLSKDLSRQTEISEMREPDLPQEEPRPLTTQDIDEHQSSADLGVRDMTLSQATTIPGACCVS